ncbi:MAG: hypothetical protein LLF96_01290 [Eubacteriales bacterium]|nr:hypothetical protein [Eubacteriales bacterium]
MRTSERLRLLKEWVQKELCDGRSMKAPGVKMAIGDIRRQEPKCYIGWTPRRPDGTVGSETDPLSVAPGILIMPNPSKAKFMEEKRFDRYNDVHRPKELGQTLAVSILFSVYEPGTRLLGFMDSMKDGAMDMSLITEGTEEGVLTLFNWMDDCMEKLLGQKFIPHTDLFVNEESLYYALYTDQSYVVDRRPLFYGFVNVEFGCYTEESANPDIEKHLI